MSRHCCTARLTTCSRSSGVKGLTRKSNAPCWVTSTAASTVARAETMTTTVRPAKRRVMCSVTLKPSMPGIFRSTSATSDGRFLQQPQGASPRRAPCAREAPPLQDPPHPLPHALLVVDDDHPDPVAKDPAGGERRDGAAASARRGAGPSGSGMACPGRRGTARSCPAGAPAAPAW